MWHSFDFEDMEDYELLNEKVAILKSPRKATIADDSDCILTVNYCSIMNCDDFATYTVLDLKPDDTLRFCEDCFKVFNDSNSKQIGYPGIEKEEEYRNRDFRVYRDICDNRDCGGNPIYLFKSKSIGYIHYYCILCATEVYTKKHKKTSNKTKGKFELKFKF